MRIRRLSAKNFGKFENYAVDFKGNLAVINGVNEAGKSTIFEMIKILLFGTGDISQDERMRYIKHGAIEAYITGEFERSDGTPLSLSRRLSENSCDLNINENFDFKNLGNVAAPIVSHLTKEVYENIYALDFHTMAAIKDDVWQGIKEEFMGADMAQELVSSTNAIHSAQGKANDIHSQQGKPSIISDLVKKREALQDKLEENQKAQQLASSDYLNLENTKRDMMDKQNQIEFENAFIAEADKMNHLREDILNIRKLAQDAGDLSAYKKWLPNIKEEYEQLKYNAENTKQLLSQAQKTPDEDLTEQVRPELDKNYSRVLEYKDSINALRYIKSSEIEPVIDDVTQIGYNNAKENWNTKFKEIIVDTADENATIEALDKINSISLSKKLKQYLEKKSELGEKINQSNIPIKKGARSFFFGLIFIIGLILILFGTSLFLKDFVTDLLQPYKIIDLWNEINTIVLDIIPLRILIIADLFCGAGLILLVLDFLFIKGKSKKALYKIREDEIMSAKTDIDVCKNEFINELCNIKLPNFRIKKPDSKIIDDMKNLKQARQDLHDAKAVYDQAAQQNNKIQNINTNENHDNKEIIKLANLLLDMPSSDIETNLVSLKNLLNSAENAKAKLDINYNNQLSNNAENEKTDLHLINELKMKNSQAQTQFEEFSNLFGADTEKSIDDIQERYNKLNKAVVLRDEILSKHPDFKAVTDRLSQLDNAGWPYTSDAMSAAKERIDILRKEIAQRQSKIGLMENGVTQAILGDVPSDIASEILKLDKKIDEYKNDYDKLRISEHIIKQGHDIFSKLHQPEVLSRAGYYLSVLTGGKYSELELSPEISTITVMIEEGNFMTPHAARLSQATCEQIYLSLRLSVIESFDADTEIMPITLDEALITWDKERLTSGLDLLAQIAKKRQILIFTCHESIVNILRENQPTAQIVELK